ncbi:hypothetical protein NQ317_006182 [Molorchus minor]|uniref:Uncharacterized protein n=1 Tax=Molorchus minor TaxID=1323400 RepID=A0ABQ9JB37_9CUCU|nr:hypothetical protein NQ317_006182 [Molorchus minor]
MLVIVALLDTVNYHHILLSVLLNDIIGKQFFPRYYRLQVNPAIPRERRVQAHLELAELVEILARLLVMRKSDTQLAFCCLGIGIEKSISPKAVVQQNSTSISVKEIEEAIKKIPQESQKKEQTQKL